MELPSWTERTSGTQTHLPVAGVRGLFVMTICHRRQKHASACPAANAAAYTPPPPRSHHRSKRHVGRGYLPGEGMCSSNPGLFMHARLRSKRVLRRQESIGQTRKRTVRNPDQSDLHILAALKSSILGEGNELLALKMGKGSTGHNGGQRFAQKQTMELGRQHEECQSAYLWRCLALFSGGSCFEGKTNAG